MAGGKLFLGEHTKNRGVVLLVFFGAGAVLTLVLAVVFHWSCLFLSLGLGGACRCVLEVERASARIGTPSRANLRTQLSRLGWLLGAFGSLAAGVLLHRFAFAFFFVEPFFEKLW